MVCQSINYNYEQENWCTLLCAVNFSLFFLNPVNFCGYNIFNTVADQR